jgi:hypothetical protein
MRVLCVCWIVGIVAVSGIPGCSKSTNEVGPAGANSPPRLESSAGNREHFDGFSFEIPSGWSRVAPDRPKTKAMLLLGGERWDSAKGMLKVDAGAAASGDATATADGLAKNISGEVRPEPIDIDGERGILIQASPTGAAMSPTRALVVFHKGEVHLIMAGAVSGVDVTNAFSHVCKTWKWEK